MITATLHTPLGDMLAASDGTALTGLWFMGQTHFPDTSCFREGSSAVLAQTQSALDDWFAGRGVTLPPLAPGGTDFQKAVWDALLHIQSGSVTTYGFLAELLGKPTAARAVGAAVGRNPITLFIPCHRVVGASGALTGYAGGLSRKSALLQLEKSRLQS